MPGLASTTGMTSTPGATVHPASLPLTLAIGFTGHRRLSDEVKSRAAILKLLQEWKARAPGIVYGVSSAASGGDLLFAESCLQLGLPIRILLPMQKTQFQEDFDEATWERALRVMDQALSVEVTGSGESRDDRYYECGIETVLQSQLLLALWDGEPSQGLGGTENIVIYAKDQGRPVVWIHSVTGAIQQFNENQELLRDPELEYLNALPDSGPQTAANNPGDLARAWFLRIDENASQAAPQFRRLAAIPILCTATASILSGVGTFRGGNPTLLGIGTGLGLMAGALPMMMKLKSRQVTWTRIRTAAEICRSMLALWRTPASYDVIGPEIVPELSGMLTSLNFLKMSDASARSTKLQDFKHQYREERVQDQMSYFSRQAARAATAARRFSFVATFSVTIALIANVWILLTMKWMQHVLQGHWRLVPALAGTIFFQIATIAGALLIVNDCHRRRQRYRELLHLLQGWDKQIESSLTWATLLRVAMTVEKALLAEVIEWRSLIRNRTVPHR